MSDDHEPRELPPDPSGEVGVSLSDDELDRLLPALALDLANPDETADNQPQRRVPPGPRPIVRKPPPRRSSLFGLIRPNGAVILLGLLGALAVVESIAAFLAYRERVASEDWAEVAALLAGSEDEPLIVANEWLGPSARMALPQARRWDSVAYPDLRFPRFRVLTYAGQRVWRGPLRAELEGLPRPELVAIHRAGELTLHEYRHDIGAPTFRLLDQIQAVTTERGRCSGGDGRYRCKEGRVEIATIEVDYRPRRCLAVELDDGAMATVDLGRVALGELAYGHVGFGDFNARLRADPSARVELLVDGEVAGRWVFSDDQGWASFAMTTPPGEHELALRVGTTVGGTWQRDGHRNNPTDRLCVELRGFAGAPVVAGEEGGA